MDQVKSATRTLEVLEFFAATRRPRALKDICDALNYPQSSMTVLLKTLTSMGYLNYDRSQRLYFPTTKVAALGQWLPEHLFGAGKVLEVLRDVGNATTETVVLATRNDIYLEYVASIPSSHQLRFEVSVGSVRYIHQSPLGWLLMSTMEKEEAEKLITRSVTAAGGETTVSVLLNEVTLSGKLGYVYGENTPFLGGATLGVLLPEGVGDGRRLSLGCGGVTERIRSAKDDHLAAIRSIVADLRAD